MTRLYAPYQDRDELAQPGIRPAKSVKFRSASHSLDGFPAENSAMPNIISVGWETGEIGPDLDQSSTPDFIRSLRPPVCVRRLAPSTPALPLTVEVAWYPSKP
jgi:hypothetical protein